MGRLRLCFMLLPIVILALSWTPVSAHWESDTTSSTNLQPRIPDSDFGDAPDPTYPTLSASNGAYHSIINSLTLGITVDGFESSDTSAWSNVTP